MVLIRNILEQNVVSLDMHCSKCFLMTNANEPTRSDGETGDIGDVMIKLIEGNDSGNDTNSTINGLRAVESGKERAFWGTVLLILCLIALVAICWFCWFAQMNGDEEASSTLESTQSLSTDSWHMVDGQQSNRRHRGSVSMTSGQQPDQNEVVGVDRAQGVDDEWTPSKTVSGSTRISGTRFQFNMDPDADNGVGRGRRLKKAQTQRARSTIDEMDQYTGRGRGGKQTY